MCGRFVFSEGTLDAVKQIAEIPEYIQPELHFGDIYPSQKALVLYNRDEHLEGEALNFGFEAKGLNKRVINARAEGLNRKGMFAPALKKDRVLIPCSGFYEWSPLKEKTLFYKEDLPVLYLAGLAIDEGFVIITTAANGSIADVHQRMPLILPFLKAKQWVLDKEPPLEILDFKPLYLDRDRQTLF